MATQWHRIEHPQAPLGHALTATIRGQAWRTWQQNDGRWRLESLSPPGQHLTVASLSEARSVAEPTMARNPKSKRKTRRTKNPPGHYRIGDDYYADTAFLNALNRLSSQKWSVRHMGFGEFVIDGPDGSIEVDRMRGTDFPGQSGRSHKLYDSDGGTKRTARLIAEMESEGLSEEMKDVAMVVGNPSAVRIHRLALRMANPV